MLKMANMTILTIGTNEKIKIEVSDFAARDEIRIMFDNAALFLEPEVFDHLLEAMETYKHKQTYGEMQDEMNSRLETANETIDAKEEIISEMNHYGRR